MKPKRGSRAKLTKVELRELANFLYDRYEAKKGGLQSNSISEKMNMGTIHDKQNK